VPSICSATSIQASSGSSGIVPPTENSKIILCSAVTPPAGTRVPSNLPVTVGRPTLTSLLRNMSLGASAAMGDPPLGVTEADHEEAKVSGMEFGRFILSVNLFFGKGMVIIGSTMISSGFVISKPGATIKKPFLTLVI